ncbi:MAG TPA: polysaccharide deacetylase [Ramlibacter sp.]|uniref:polysaccharide deacetylase family protein n=1 Tax=Ramlibacter sp. TaxID=1917967 RepID=UPI002BD2007B|nr:polysaccharide deacetylase [Ramlibacter sp.]HVZ45169.1 polysaccharide deacetylase [Ramlibacter sp.]
MTPDYTTRAPRAANLARPAPEFAWPKPYTAALMPAFDVDGESIWLGFDALSEQRLVSRSYGGYEARVGVPKILQALRERDLRATFFITGWALDAHPALCEAIAGDGHEIAHHGYWHKKPEPGEDAAMAEELDRGLDAFKRVLGVKPVGYRAPYGENTAEGLAMLRERGIVYSSSFRDDIRPYRHVLADGSAGPIEIPVNFAFDDFGYSVSHARYPRTLATREHVLSIWKDELAQTSEWGGIVSMVMHPQASGRPKGFRIMTEFLDHALAQERLWIATGAEVARHFEACEKTRVKP